MIRALIDRSHQLRLQNVRAKAIVARLDPGEALRELLETLSRLAGGTTRGDLVRWFAQRSLLGAHEQLVLGSSMCWTGDAMNRDPGKRDALDLFEQASPVKVLYGVSSFARIWPICSGLSSTGDRRGLVSAKRGTGAGPGGKAPAELAFERRTDHPAATRH